MPRLIAVMCACAIVPSVSAMGLLEGYRQVLAHDPQLAAALQDKAAMDAEGDIAFSGLLPKVGVSGSISRVRGDRTASLGNLSATDPLNYSSRDWAITLTQPIFNKSIWEQYKQSRVKRDFASESLRVRQSDAVVRYVSTYLDVLVSAENLELAKRQISTLEQLRLLAKQSRGAGEGTVVDMDDAQARLDLAEAQRIDAESVLRVVRKRLSDLVSVPVDALRVPGTGLVLEMPEPAKVDWWIEKAVVDSPLLRSSQHGVEIARQDIDIVKANHYPTVNLVMQSQKTSSQTLATLNEQSNTRLIGVQVNVPIYSGGAISAASQSAAARWGAARSTHEATQHQVEEDVVRQFSGVTGGINRIKALLVAERSSEKALKSNEAGVKGGVRAHIDVLNAEQQLYQVRRDLTQAVAGYLLSWVMLKSDIGALTMDDVARMDAYFNQTRELAGN
ncbi:TolC family outer membrane protein [Burkholderiaceae bacterium DAT-1]|nr:TolC family outer membrane protein [Burkholderiaceae bacterium DAT-1]